MDVGLVHPYVVREIAKSYIEKDERGRPKEIKRPRTTYDIIEYILELT